MRLSEFAEKRIINIATGEILGSAGDCDLLIDPASGKIMQLHIQMGGGGLLNKGEKQIITVPWAAIQKVGPEIIVIDTAKGVEK